MIAKLTEVIGPAVAVLGYELVDLECLQHGGLLRIFIDKPNGIGVGDCVAVSNQLTRLLAVEGIDYGRLEVSSPGLDRVLKQEKDFTRFAGELASVRLRTPLAGRRKFVGIVRDASNGILQLEVDGQLLPFELANLERARLVPKI